MTPIPPRCGHTAGSLYPHQSRAAHSHDALDVHRNKSQRVDKTLSVTAETKCAARGSNSAPRCVGPVPSPEGEPRVELRDGIETSPLAYRASALPLELSERNRDGANRTHQEPACRAGAAPCCGVPSRDQPENRTLLARFAGAPHRQMCRSECRGLDLNQHRRDLQSRALPLELPRHIGDLGVEPSRVQVYKTRLRTARVAKASAGFEPATLSLGNRAQFRFGRG